MPAFSLYDPTGGRLQSSGASKQVSEGEYIVDLLASFLHGWPDGGHMRHSGYEAVVDFLANSRIIWVRDYAKLTKLSYPLRLAHILPKSYSSLDAELAALRSDGKILHHLHAEDTLWISMFHSFIRSRNVVATFHRPPHVLEATMPFFWKKQIRNLAGIIAQSPQQHDYLRSLCGTKTMVSLIPHGIDTDYFTPGNNERSREVILSVGAYLRDPTTLLKAMNVLSHKAPDLRLIAISKQPLPITKNLIRLANISDEELLAYYREASFIVLPFENLVASNAMLEAMACGMPIICPDLESARFYMGDVPTTYKLGNPDDLADKILLLYENDHERRKLASEMRERAQLFSWFRISSMIRSLYETILNC